MQEKESTMDVRCELKIRSLCITVRHQSASLVMPNSYPRRDGNCNPHLTTIIDSYTPGPRIAVPNKFVHLDVSIFELFR